MQSAARNDDIEILRAYSILLVLYEHLGAVTESSAVDALRHAYNGWTGVDLFFGISGFVIYRSLQGSLHPDLDLPGAVRASVEFWIRRVWRLVPAAWLWLLLGLPVAVTFRTEEVGPLVDNIADLLASLLNFQNFHRYNCNLHGEVCGRLYSPFWSLSLEAQFYLLLPVGMALLRRRGLALLMIALILVQLPLRRAANGTDLGWFIRTDALAWGVLLGILCGSRLTEIVRPRFLANPAARAAFTLGILLLLGTSQIFWREAFFVGLVAALAAGLVWAASYDAGYVHRLLGAAAALRWMGSRSYGLYVAHMVVFKATRQIYQALDIIDTTTATKLLYGVTAYGATLAAAELTYRFVEDPLRRHGRTWRSGPQALGTGGAFAGSGIAAARPAGLP